jgi:hypothetical protein
VNFLIQNPHLTQSDPRKIDPHKPYAPPTRHSDLRGSHSDLVKHCPQAASSSQCLLFELGL